MSAGVTCLPALISIATTSRALSTTRSTSAPASVRQVDSFHPLRRAWFRLDAGEHPEAERAIPVDVIRLEDGERVEVLEDHRAGQ